MYLHIGDNNSIFYGEIVAILNLDVINSNSPSQEMINWLELNKSQKNNKKPKKIKSCIITDKESYFSTITALTLFERAKNQNF
ncbi:MAG: extracellular matrix/biofilm biosynthesis regulator RemA family protein [Bacillota bacterium]